MFPDLGSTQQQAAVLVGFFLPLVLAVPIQSHWPTELKTLFSVAAYAAAGAITAAATGELTGKSFWQTTLEILVLGVVGYQGVWKPSGVAPSIETRTNTSNQPAQAPAGGDPSPTPTVTLTPSADAFLAAGARFVDELTHGLQANRVDNGAAGDDSDAPKEISPKGQSTEPAQPDEPGAEKSAAAWVRPRPR